MLIWCKSAQHGRALLRLSNNRKVNTQTYWHCMSCQSIYLTRNPWVKMLSKVESHNIFMYIRLPTSHGDYARPVPSGCFFENIHDNQILSTWSTGQHVANLKFQNRFFRQLQYTAPTAHWFAMTSSQAYAFPTLYTSGGISLMRYSWCFRCTS